MSKSNGPPVAEDNFSWLNHTEYHSNVLYSNSSNVVVMFNTKEASLNLTMIDIDKNVTEDDERVPDYFFVLPFYGTRAQIINISSLGKYSADNTRQSP